MDKLPWHDVINWWNFCLTLISWFFFLSFFYTRYILTVDCWRLLGLTVNIKKQLQCISINVVCCLFPNIIEANDLNLLFSQIMMIFNYLVWKLCFLLLFHLSVLESNWFNNFKKFNENVWKTFHFIELERDTYTHTYCYENIHVSMTLHTYYQTTKEFSYFFIF